MTSERWNQISDLYNAVYDLPSSERQAYLDSHVEDAEIRHEVEAMLKSEFDAPTIVDPDAKGIGTPINATSTDTHNHGLLGQEIDGYRIIEVVGRGGMGTVYRAVDIELDKDVALKMIDPAMTRDSAFIGRFQVEARALARVESPYIVRVHAMRRTERGAFIVMEYIDGGTLADLLKDGPLPWPRALPIVLEMLSALEHAHGVGIIHRDIKPSNILLTRDGAVKVTDFGLAKLQRDEGNITVTRGVAGTLRYMSPEQVRGLRDLDHRSDLYSLGMTIYMMLTGRPAYDRGTGEFEIMRRIVEEPVTPVDEIAPDVPEPVAASVMKLLEKDPDRRFQSASEARIAFEASRMTSGESKEVRPRPKAGAPHTRRWIWSGIVATVFAAIIVAVLNPFGAASFTIDVASIPGGAAVILDGRSVGITPLEAFRVNVQGVDADSIRIRVQKAGFAPFEARYAFEAGGHLSVGPLSLEPARPAGDEAQESSHEPDNGTMERDRPGQADASNAVREQNDAGTPQQNDAGTPQQNDAGTPQRNISENESTRSQETGPNPGVVVVALRAESGGEIALDGYPAVQFADREVAPGSHTIQCIHPARSREFTVDISGGATASFTCHFEQMLNVVARIEGGSGTNAMVMINGSPTRQSPVVFSRGPGTYQITAIKDGFETINGPQTITIEPSLEEPDPVTLTFKLSRR